MQNISKMIEWPESLVIPEHPIGDKLGPIGNLQKLALDSQKENGLFHKPGRVLTKTEKYFMQQVANIIADGKMYFSDSKKFIREAHQAGKIKKEIGTKFYMANDIIIEYPYIQVSLLPRKLDLDICIPNEVGAIHSHPEPGTFSPSDVRHITNGELLFILLFNTARNYWAILTRNPNQIIYEITASTLTTYIRYFIDYLSQNNPNILKEIQYTFPIPSKRAIQILHVIYPKILSNLGYIYIEAPTIETLLQKTREIFIPMKEIPMKHTNPPTKQAKLVNDYEIDSFCDLNAIYEHFGEPVPTTADMKKFWAEQKKMQAYAKKIQRKNIHKRAKSKI